MIMKQDKVKLEIDELGTVKEPLVRTKEELDAGVEPTRPILDTIRRWEWTDKDFSIFVDDDFAWLIPEKDRIPNPYWAEAKVKHPEAKGQKSDVDKMDIRIRIDLPGKGFIRYVGYVSEARAEEVKGRLCEGRKCYEALCKQIERMYPGVKEE